MADSVTACAAPGAEEARSKAAKARKAAEKDDSDDDPWHKFGDEDLEHPSPLSPRKVCKCVQHSACRQAASLEAAVAAVSCMLRRTTATTTPAQVQGRGSGAFFTSTPCKVHDLMLSAYAACYKLLHAFSMLANGPWQHAGLIALLCADIAAKTLMPCCPSRASPALRC